MLRFALLGLCTLFACGDTAKDDTADSGISTDTTSPTTTTSSTNTTTGTTTQTTGTGTTTGTTATGTTTGTTSTGTTTGTTTTGTTGTGTTTGSDIPTTSEGASQIDATDADLWVYVNLAEGTIVSPSSPDTSEAWHLGFKRYDVKLNGGSGGAAGVQALFLEGQDYDALLEAPSEGYMSDGDTLVLEDWYSYNYIEHTLAPNDYVYVIKGWDDDYYKLEFLGYYDDAGTSGMVSFQYDMIAAP